MPADLPFAVAVRKGLQYGGSDQSVRVPRLGRPESGLDPRGYPGTRVREVGVRGRVAEVADELGLRIGGMRGFGVVVAPRYDDEPLGLEDDGHIGKCDRWRGR